MRAADQAEVPPVPEPWLASLHLVTLSALAFAQPLFSVLAAHPEFFAIREVAVAELLALTVFWMFLLPLPLVVAEWTAAAFGRRARALVHGVLMAGLGLAIAAQVAKRFVDRGAWPLALGILAGVLWAYLSRRRAAQLFLSYASPALLAVPLAFLVGSRLGGTMGGAGTEGYELRRSGATTPIVLVVFDEFPVTSLLDAEGRIEPHRFPNLARLAAGASWFRDARAVTDGTSLALPAILTGKLPVAGQLPRLADHPRNLFTLFGGDYRIWAVEPVVRLCPREVNRAAPESFRARRFLHLLEDSAVVSLHLQLPSSYGERFLPPISHTWGGFAAREPRKELRRRRGIELHRRFHADPGRDFRRFVESLREDASSDLYFLHVGLPHYPWQYFPSGRAYDYGRVGLPGHHENLWADDERLVALAYQRFLLQVRFVDRLIGELVARLRELGLFERSLLVLTADHGGSFRPGDNRRFVTTTNLHDLVAVPLLVKRPFQAAGELIDRPVSSIDVLPTILEVVGVEAPRPVDGRSAYDPAPRGEGAGRIYTAHGKTVELPEGFEELGRPTLRWKLERFGDGSDPASLFAHGPRPELFGREVAALPSGQAPGVGLLLDGAEAYDDVDLRSPFSRAWITGTLASARPFAGGSEIAIAVNGRIEATTWTFGDSRRRRFHVPIAESALVAGRNRVEVFLIEETASGWRLSRPAN